MTTPPKRCGKPQPAYWKPEGLTCELEKGHEIQFEYTKKLKIQKVKLKGGHRVLGNRWWPIGTVNNEYL